MKEMLSRRRNVRVKRTVLIQFCVNWIKIKLNKDLEMYRYFTENANIFILTGHRNFKYEKKKLKVEFEIFSLIVTSNLIILD